MEKTHKAVYFHVGLGKTGTTYLQHKFFPKLRNIHYIQRTKYKNFTYARIIERSDYARYLVSNEFDVQLEREAEKIASVFPDARIIMVLRRHDEWIASQYRRQVKNGRALSFREFIDVQDDAGEWKQKELYYMPKIRFLQECFGRRPLVLFYDEFKHDPYAFFDRIAAFTGATYDRDAIDCTPRHRSYNEKQLKIIRNVSRRLFRQKRFVYAHSYWVRKLQRHTRMVPRYLVLYAARLIPSFFVDSAPLIPENEKAQIREFYAEDWDACRAYATDNPV